VFARQALYGLSHDPVLFALGFFQIGSHIYTQVDLDRDPPIYASCSAGITGTHHHAHL
jgi:hypothetical protein